MLLLTSACVLLSILVLIATFSTKSEVARRFALLFVTTWLIKQLVFYYLPPDDAVVIMVTVDFILTLATVVATLTRLRWWLMWLAITAQIQMLIGVVLMMNVASELSVFVYLVVPNMLYMVQLALISVPWVWRAQRRNIAGKRP